MSAITTTQEQQAEALKTLHRAAQDQAEHIKRLALLLEALLVDIAVGGGETDRIIDNNPFAGHRRHSLSNRRLTGSDSFAVPSGSAAIVDVLPANPGRIGGQLINSGSSPVIVCLAGATRYVAGATAAFYLASGGGFWDMTIGKSVYAGAISAYGSGGSSTLTVASA